MQANFTSHSKYSDRSNYIVIKGQEILRVDSEFIYTAAVLKANL
jgi:hypothetical protein